MYKVPVKTKAKKLPPRSRPAVLAPASVRSRKIDSGSTGCSARRSITPNAASRAADAASTATVLVALQPYCGAWEMASTRATSPPVPATAPARSNRRRVVASRLSGTIRGVSASAAAPIGTFR
jgi:hypothetical protein